MPLSRPSVSVHLLPSLIPPSTLGGGIAVVVDVLRATTAMIQALASGVEAIRPCLEVDEAREIARGLPPGTALLGGERQGLPIEGFDLGNSPGSYTPETCLGKTLVMTTTNGTRAILASRDAERVLVAAFTNLAATVAELRESGLPVHLVCSGTDGHVSLEDVLLAGAIVEALEEDGYPLGNDSAEIATSFWFNEDYLSDEGHSTLADVLARGRGGRRVTEIGLAADIADAAAVDAFEFAAELRRDPSRIVRVS